MKRGVCMWQDDRTLLFFVTQNTWAELGGTETPQWHSKERTWLLKLALNTHATDFINANLLSAGSLVC